MLEAEDEQDACAATKAKAEEAAELAEFDEGIPYNDEATKVCLGQWFCVHVSCCCMLSHRPIVSLFNRMYCGQVSVQTPPYKP